MSTQILAECVKAFPARPVIDVAATPYTRDELESRIDYWMPRLAALGAATVGPAPMVWVGRRRQLIHKGGKP